MDRRNTRQKREIQNFLINRKDHPTAEVVYTELRRVLPKISLGTVYRNLNSMAEEGDILKLKLDDGLDHFDARTDSHYHFICRCCGGISDIDEADDAITITDSKFRGRIEGHFTYFYGICEGCIS